MKSVVRPCFVDRQSRERDASISRFRAILMRKHNSGFRVQIPHRALQLVFWTSFALTALGPITASSGSAAEPSKDQLALSWNAKDRVLSATAKLHKQIKNISWRIMRPAMNVLSPIADDASNTTRIGTDTIQVANATPGLYVVCVDATVEGDPNPLSLRGCAMIGDDWTLHLCTQPTAVPVQGPAFPGQIGTTGIAGYQSADQVSLNGKLADGFVLPVPGFFGPTKPRIVSVADGDDQAPERSPFQQPVAIRGCQLRVGFRDLQMPGLPTQATMTLTDSTIGGIKYSQLVNVVPRSDDFGDGVAEFGVPALPPGRYSLNASVMVNGQWVSTASVDVYIQSSAVFFRNREKNGANPESFSPACCRAKDTESRCCQVGPRTTSSSGFSMSSRPIVIPVGMTKQHESEPEQGTDGPLEPEFTAEPESESNVTTEPHTRSRAGSIPRRIKLPIRDEAPAPPAPTSPAQPRTGHPKVEQAAIDQADCCKDVSDGKSFECDNEYTVREFVIASAASFPRPGFDRDFSRYDIDGAVIYENMQFRICNKTGFYEVKYCTSTPETVQLRMQILIRLEKLGWYTLTLPTKTIALDMKSGRDEQTKVRQIVVQGTAPYLINRVEWICDVRRRGSARFGSLPATQTVADAPTSSSPADPSSSPSGTN